MYYSYQLRIVDIGLPAKLDVHQLSGIIEALVHCPILAIRMSTRPGPGAQARAYTYSYQVMHN